MSSDCSIPALPNPPSIISKPYTYPREHSARRPAAHAYSQCLGLLAEGLPLRPRDSPPLLHEADTEDEDVAPAKCHALLGCARLEVFDRDRMRRPWVVWKRLRAALREEVDEVEEHAAAADAVLGPV